MTFNYIEICTSNEETDILRLLIAVMGILMKNEEIIQELQEVMMKLSEDQLELFKVMIDYASKIGEKPNLSE
mgnify:CR=1 FL=1